MLRMEEINLEELRYSGALQDLQAGAPLDAFNRSARIRHSQLTSWWERCLAVLSLAFIVVTLVNLVLRNL
jgi:hypothetical protein